MEFTAAENTKYTICFDLFQTPAIFDSNTTTSDLYLKTLVKKHIVHSLTTYKRSSWIDKIWELKDLFYPKVLTDLTKNILLSDWSEKIKAAKLDLKSGKSVNEVNKIDYRFSAIEITAIETNNMNMTPNLNQFMSSKSISTSYNNDKLSAELLGFGVVRLYKDSDDHINPFKIDTPGLKHVPGDDTTLAILAVPFYFSASDLLLGFFDEHDIDHLSHIRLIKSSMPNRFMILLKFRSKEDVQPFMRKYQGRKFNSFEPETCSIVEIKEIVFRPKKSEDSEHIKVALPYLLEDPFTDTDKSHESHGKSLPKKYTELPTCPVCLDRLDSTVSGLITAPCQHTFHSSCLSKWKDDTCPVCRYSNKTNKSLGDLSSLSLLDSANISNDNLDTTEKCMECGLREHIWICLICGHVGCGRYDQQHAIRHWENTGHCFAMEANTQRVWDYAADGYVHRLVQNEADGKIVELPLRDESKKTSDEKVEKIGFEYSKMLIAQLESQREYYENIVFKLNTDMKFCKDSLNKAYEKMNSYADNFAATEKKIDSLKHIAEKVDTLQHELDESNALNDAYLEKIDILTKENEEVKDEKQELQEQVTDLMFFLESQEKFKDAPDDLKEGQVVMVPKKNKSKSSKNKKR